MKRFLFLSLIFIVTAMQAQEATTGAIGGKLSDKEMNGEPLPFANVLLKDSAKGTTSDYDGIYLLDKLEPGTYTVVFSFVGYETLEVPNVVVEAGKVTEVNTELGSSAAALDEVVITTVSRRDSEVALLIEQKNSVDIKESIGAQELAKLGVSDAATATTKISGVTSSEASGDIFVRGLGDRYLYTTMNGLPIPSDDVERKNIDLGLFPTRVIQNISISKNYSAENSADQASGSIDITSRELRGKSELDLGMRFGANTNAVGQFNNFKVSPNQQDVYFGFYDQNIPTEFALNNQSWDPQNAVFPINRRYALTAGKEFGDLEVLFTASNSVDFEYNQGTFANYRNNDFEDGFTDATNYKKTDNNTALLDLGYQINDNNRIKATSLFINKVSDEVFEGGRNGEGIVFEESDRGDDFNQFVRDQNTKQTRLWVNQLHGFHEMWDSKNEIEWAAGYNMVDADEPNRIRNEVNLHPTEPILLGETGAFQQRKSNQQIDDREINAFIQDQYNFIQDEESEKKAFIKLGGNFRNKERDFYSKFYGVEERNFNTVNPESIDNLTGIFTTENFNSRALVVNNLSPDLYNGTLESLSGFAFFNYGNEKWNLNVGARVQKDDIDVVFDVNNYPSNLPNFVNKSYDNIYPSINFRFSPNEDSNIRLAASRTITLPEFKEIAPFEYVAQTGLITRGNPELEASTNTNFDIKYEIFPSSGELISLTGFYKNINDPINKARERGSAPVFSYFNAGDEANIYGLELEARMDVIENENEAGLDVAVTGNVTRMWHKQDLKDVYNENGDFIRTFRYNGKDEIGLQGASDWIFNASLNVSTETENPFTATLVGAYASDKIFALGNPESQRLDQIDIQYNDEIIEKGFVTLDLIMSKELNDNWSLEFRGQNLLNPEIERYQEIRPISGNVPASNQTVRSYDRGAVLSLGVNYSF
ncbi:outer membrane receptor protein involved in Fe transport [Christiangramia gaetbulicola]|uniref:Outer membrane receptor protein involved in Fe transport n=1 Tax=Christiangramia gaetbulicola TaxID=703340 RepID=A0A2T6AL88_9FLAO|nr:TonB-dependent receptor [Christiangramia gaetbulicola]PTX44547.1 outer membrane receptor protein involved in Fe transport [Christiangramia gaetbulicola]